MNLAAMDEGGGPITAGPQASRAAQPPLEPRARLAPAGPRETGPRRLPLGGLVPCSFVDFPGRLSAVVFLAGCNLRCPYCHNPGLLGPVELALRALAPRLHASAEQPRKARDRGPGDSLPTQKAGVHRTDVQSGPLLVDGRGGLRVDRGARASETEGGEGAVLSFLASRRGRLEGVVVSGGEPTLSPALEPFLAAIRALGFPVKLDTNGTQPQRLARLLGAGLVDYVAMDLKDEPSAYPARFGMQEPPDRLRESLDLIVRSGVAYELRTTVVGGWHDEARLLRMAQWLGRGVPWILQPYRAVESLRGAHAPPPFATPTDAALRHLAAQMRAAHGVDCRARSESHLARSTLPGTPIA